MDHSIVPAQLACFYVSNVFGKLRVPVRSLSEITSSVVIRVNASDGVTLENEIWDEHTADVPSIAGD
jgi:hypothetical protein